MRFTFRKSDLFQKSLNLQLNLSYYFLFLEELPIVLLSILILRTD